MPSLGFRSQLCVGVVLTDVHVLHVQQQSKKEGRAPRQERFGAVDIDVSGPPPGALAPLPEGGSGGGGGGSPDRGPDSGVRGERGSRGRGGRGRCAAR